MLTYAKLNLSWCKYRPHCIFLHFFCFLRLSWANLYPRSDTLYLSYLVESLQIEQMGNYDRTGKCQDAKLTQGKTKDAHICLCVDEQLSNRTQFSVHTIGIGDSQHIIIWIQVTVKISDIRPHLIPKLKCFSSRLAVVFVQSIEARC